MAIQERLRHEAETLRTKSMPLKHLIPLLQQAADALDAEQQELKPEPSVAAVKAAFEEGFYAAKTYNDDLLNDSDDEWLMSAAFASIKETP